MRHRLNLLLIVAVAPLAAQTRIDVHNFQELKACVARPAGPALVCALQSTPSPYAVSGEPLTIRRSDTTIEGVAEAGQDPPTLKRVDPALKRILSIPGSVSNVTIRNLQFDGNKAIAPSEGFMEISAEGTGITIAGNYFGNSTYFCVYIGGPGITVRDNTFGKLMVGGSSRDAPGINAAIKVWGAKPGRFTVESNKISNYRCAVSVTGVPNGTDPANASVIANNMLYHDSVCIPDCGGGEIYVASSTNVKITNNHINGGWEESPNRETEHSYGIEIDSRASHVYIGSNEIYNNSISGIWIGNGSNHITVENSTVHDNGLNGVQIGGTGRLAPVSDVSIIGLNSSHNDLHRSPRAPYPSMPRFWGVMIQNANRNGVCIQTDSRLNENSKGAVYSDSAGAYSKSAACPRPYN